MARPVRIGIIGDFNPAYISHPETSEAIRAASSRLGLDVTGVWVATEEIERSGPDVLDPFDAVWVAPGSPYRSLEGALAGIRYVRERGKPLVGT